MANKKTFRVPTNADLRRIYADRKMKFAGHSNRDEWPNGQIYPPTWLIEQRGWTAAQVEMVKTWRSLLKKYFPPAQSGESGER